MPSAEYTVTVDMGPLDALINGMEERVQAVIEEYAALIVARAKQFSPVRTGALRDSVTAHLTAMAAEITAGEGLDYAVFVEYGTILAPAQPFLRPAVEQYAAAFTAALQAALGGS